MDKRHYSAFSGTDLDIRLRERHVDTVILTGVLTDICVLHTAVDAYNPRLPDRSRGTCSGVTPPEITSLP